VASSMVSRGARGDRLDSSGLTASRIMVHGVAAAAPPGDALDEPAGTVPALAQELDCRDGQDAVRAAAVGHDLLAFGKLAEAVRQLGHGHRKSTRDVPGGKLVHRPHVDERHIACDQAAPKFFGRDGLECVPALKVRVGDLPDLGVAVATQGLEGEKECGHGFVSKAVPDVRAIAPGLDEARLPERAEVSTRILDCGRGLLGELFNGLLALAQEIQQLESLGARDRVTDPGELGVQGILEGAMVSGHRALTILRFNRILEQPATRVKSPSSGWMVGAARRLLRGYTMKYALLLVAAILPLGGLAAQESSSAQPRQAHVFTLSI
jgi:hypothetical protein